MRNLFPKAFLAAWIAVGALWAGTLHAQGRERERLVGLRGRLPFCRRVARTACIGGGAAEPATCSPRRPQVGLLTRNCYGRPLDPR